MGFGSLLHSVYLDQKCDDGQITTNRIGIDRWGYQRSLQEIRYRSSCEFEFMKFRNTIQYENIQYHRFISSEFIVMSIIFPPTWSLTVFKVGRMVQHRATSQKSMIGLFLLTKRVHILYTIHILYTMRQCMCARAYFYDVLSPNIASDSKSNLFINSEFKAMNRLKENQRASVSVLIYAHTE